MDDVITLGHGSGGALTQELIQTLFVPAFDNAPLRDLGDAAVFEAAAGRFAFTTDSFVVNPLFFPGGDIGKLAVNGTINDLAVAGAQPLCLSVGLILEEGFPLADLRRVVESMAQAAAAAEVPLITGDTKVVERGRGDGVYVNTAGVGGNVFEPLLSPRRVEPGDRILVSGPLGDHEICVLLARGELAFESDLQSDCAPVHGLVQAILAAGGPKVRFLRDPTRGGLATVLNEVAAEAGYDLLLREAAIPVRPEVRAVCDLLGFDPLYLANEGKVVALVAEDQAEAVLNAMQGHERGREAAIIGEVLPAQNRRVLLETGVGGRRIVDLLVASQWPRIC